MNDEEEEYRPPNIQLSDEDCDGVWIDYWEEENGEMLRTREGYWTGEQDACMEFKGDDYNGWESILGDLWLTLVPDFILAICEEGLQ